MTMTAHRSNDSGETAVLSSSGMTCDGCAITLAKILSRVPGVTDANADPNMGPATVAGGARQEAIIEAVEAAGYGVQWASSSLALRIG